MTGEKKVTAGRRSSRAVLAAGVCFLLIVVGAGSAFAEDSSPPAGSVPTAQEISQAIESESGPSIASQLTDSQAAEGMPHRDLGRDEALELMQGVFGPALQSSAGPFDELHVEKFLADNVAVIPAGEQPEATGISVGGDSGSPYEGPTLMDSTLPLRTEGPTGHEEAVDLGLEHSEGEIQPAAPLVEVGIPTELGEGIELPETGVQVELAGAPQERSPSTVDESVAFYPNVAQDTDLAVAPTPTGVETLTQLRSADSPRSQTFELTLPAGATLQASKDGGAKVISGEETLLGVAPPTALDATGAEVPVSLEVSGDSLTLAVSPKESSVYPILLDPLFQSYDWRSEKWAQVGITGNIGKEQWNPEVFHRSAFNSYNVGNEYGLNAYGSGSAQAGDHASYVYAVPRYFEELASYQPPPTSFISHMTLSSLTWSAKSANNQPYLIAGLWDPSNGWVSLLSQDGHTEHGLPDANFQYQFENINANTKASDTNVKLASVGAWALETVSSSGLNNVHVGTATIELAEPETGNNPGFGSASGPSQWVNQTAAPINFSVTDTGLGVYSITVSDEQATPHSWKTTYNCTGVGGKACPRTWSSAYYQPAPKYEPSVLPAGIDTLKLVAEDPLGHTSSVSKAQVKVDHTAPSISLSGSMTEQGTLGAELPHYTLKVDATDGSEAAPQSGVASTEVKLDGKQVDLSAPGCSTKDCAITQEWSFDSRAHSQGKHTIEVIATDAVGLSTTKTLVIEDEAPTDSMPPKVSLSGSMTEEGSLGTTRPHYTLKVNASDGTVVSPTPVFSFGSYGEGEGLLGQPYGIATDSSGNLWVADYLNGCVKEFNPKGEELRELGAEGWSEAFSFPYGIAVDSADNVWVADSGNNRIKEFNPEGEFLLREFGTYGSGNGQLSEPTDIAFDSKGNLWITDMWNNRIQEFNPKGEFLSQFGVKGTGLGQLYWPFGLAIDSHDRIWVADSNNNRVQEFNTKGEYLRQVGSAGKGDGQLGWPFRVTVGEDDNVWVADVNNHRVQEFSPQGKYLTQFGLPGTGEGQFEEIGSIAIDPEGNFWIADAVNGRIAEWSGSASQSGVASTAIKVDGKVVDSAAPGCQTENCSMTREWTLDSAAYGAGKHTVEASATDAFGNTTTKTLPIELNPDTTPPVIALSGTVTEQATLGTALPSYALKLSATDGTEASPQSGVASTEIKVDGKLIDSTSPGCATQNCAITRGGTINAASYSKGQHTVEAVATDAVGHSTTKSLTIELTPDTTPPAVALSGTVTEQETLGTTRPRYSLELNASDEFEESSTAFGSEGSENGRFSYPSGITVDPKGNVWVADSNNNRVQEFGSKGEYLSQFGSEGSGNGQLSYPSGVAVDPSGDIWVADMFHQRVQEFSPEGAYIRKFGLGGSGDGRLRYPEDIAVDPEGNVWVADTGNNRIQEFSPEGAYIRKFGSEGSENGQFSYPSGVAVDPEGNVWVADTGNNRIQEFSPEGAYIRKFGSEGEGSDQFSYPEGIAVDPEGNIWVADTGNSRIEEFGPKGEYLSQFGSEGEGSDQFSYPEGIAVDPEGNVWVADTGNNRIQKWDHASLPSGVVSTTIKVDGKVVDSSSPGCPNGNCSISREWKLESPTYSVGKHTVEASATDAFGNSTTKTLGVEVQRDTSSPQLEVSGPLAEAPEGWVEQEGYSVTGSAQDAGFGATQLKLLIDGEQVGASTQTCGDGGCPLSHAFTVNTANYSGGAHPAELIATDGAGNTAKHKWTMNVNPEGNVTAEEAEDTLEAADATSESTVVAPTSEVISAEERADGNDPSLIEGEGEELESRGVPDLSIIGRDPTEGFTIETPETSIQAEPTEVSGGSTQMVVVEEAAAVAANTTSNVDTVIRPIFDGVTTFTNIRDATAPETYSWNVALAEGQTLKSIDPQDAEVDLEDGTEAMLITAEFAHDAIGTNVPTSLSVSNGHVITLTVSHREASYVYPVIAGSGWEGGFSTQIVGKPKDEQELREERERIEQEEREALEQAAGEEGGEEVTTELHLAPKIRARASVSFVGAPEMVDYIHRIRRSRAVAKYCSQWFIDPCSVWSTEVLGTWFWNGVQGKPGGNAWRGNTTLHCEVGSNPVIYNNAIKVDWAGKNPAPYGYGEYLNEWCNFETAFLSPEDTSQDTHRQIQNHLFGDGYQKQHIHEYGPEE